MTTDMTDLDQIDVLQDSLVKTWGTYCIVCGKTRSGGGKSIDFAVLLFDEGWTADSHRKIKCPECSKKS